MASDWAETCRGTSHLAARICKLLFGWYPELIIMNKFWNEDRAVEQIKRNASFAPLCTRRCRAVFTWLAVTPQWPLLWLDLNPTLWFFWAYWLGETDTETGALRVLDFGEKAHFYRVCESFGSGSAFILFCQEMYDLVHVEKPGSEPSLFIRQLIFPSLTKLTL